MEQVPPRSGTGFKNCNSAKNNQKSKKMKNLFENSPFEDWAELLGFVVVGIGFLLCFIGLFLGW